MASEKLDPIVPYLVGQFRRAVIVLDFGHQDERRDMEIAAIKSLNDALMMLDSYGEPGRLSLLPLLDDSEPGARVYAAKYLMELVPDRALETLKDVAVRTNTSAHKTWHWGFSRITSSAKRNLRNFKRPETKSAVAPQARADKLVLDGFYVTPAATAARPRSTTA